jgi:hypothetical protein
VWWARIPRRSLPPVEHSLIAVDSDRFPSGTAVDLSALAARGRRPTGWLVDVRYRSADGGVTGIAVADVVAEPGVPVWFAEVHHAGGLLPAVTLSAFAGDAFPPGALVAPSRVGAAGVRVLDRVAEVRWLPRCGLLDAVEVAPGWRGQGLDRLVAVAADGLCRLRGWPGLTGDGAARQAVQRGPLGVERLLADAVPRLI